ncbi:MAG: cation diffusion facilitator family transporter [Leptolyngbyaceae bacterium]|nr:cation diffusion facilitator family transporter [Leptolyngbyaceae bacterium]
MTQLSVPESRPQTPHHGHRHGDEPHSHTHGAIDPAIATSERGLWAVKVSLVGLMITAIAQATVFWLSGSVALLADLIHNVGDALTALPLGVAFIVGRRKPTERFAYGYGRVEDLAGLAVVGVVLLSAMITAYESIDRFYHPQPIHHLGALAIAAIIGFIGNETVAVFRMRVGREINSAALVADGQHALADGLVSLAVLVSATGVWLGYVWADPVIGLVITALLLKIVWESGQTIFTRLLDGVDPEVIDSLRHAAEHVTQVESVSHIRARWLGHRLYTEIDVVVAGECSVKEGQAIANAVRDQIQTHISYLDNATVRVVCEDP